MQATCWNLQNMSRQGSYCVPPIEQLRHAFLFDGLEATRFRHYSNIYMTSDTTYPNIERLHFHCCPNEQRREIDAVLKRQELVWNLYLQLRQLFRECGILVCGKVQGLLD